MAYKSRVVSALLAHERRLLSKLSTPQKIQDYLDSLSINYELRGETYISPRRVMEARSAHCFEGAVFAAAALAYHGQRPLLMDLRTIGEEEDHVIALFKQNGYWGAISKTNHPVLRYRDPVYASLRELALSYFHEYFDARGIKSLREYSAPFDLSKYPVERWLTASEDLFDLVEALDSSRHFPLVPKKNSSSLRSASKIERVASEHPEWSRRGKRRAL